jgi:hypothetical protein
MERATGIEPVLPAWESKLSTLYFQHLQNRSAKTCVHALHTVHALPDLRIAAGRLRDVFLREISITSEMLSVITNGLSLLQKKLASQLSNLGD